MPREIKDEKVFLHLFHSLRFERGKHRGTHKFKDPMVMARLDIIIPEPTVSVLISR